MFKQPKSPPPHWDPGSTSVPKTPTRESAGKLVGKVNTFNDLVMPQCVDSPDWMYTYLWVRNFGHLPLFNPPPTAHVQGAHTTKLYLLSDAKFVADELFRTWIGEGRRGSPSALVYLMGCLSTTPCSGDCVGRMVVGAISTILSGPACPWWWSWWRWPDWNEGRHNATERHCYCIRGGWWVGVGIHRDAAWGGGEGGVFSFRRKRCFLSGRVDGLF